MTIGDPKSVTFQSLHEGGHHAGGHKLANNLAIFDAALLELENSLGGNRATFHAGNFGEFDDLPAAVI